MEKKSDPDKNLDTGEWMGCMEFPFGRDIRTVGFEKEPSKWSAEETSAMIKWLWRSLGIARTHFTGKSEAGAGQ